MYINLSLKFLISKAGEGGGERKDKDVEKILDFVPYPQNTFRII